LRGDPAAARQAIRRAVARDLAMLAMVAATLALHVAATTWRASLAYCEQRCNGGLTEGCYRVARIVPDNDAGTGACQRVVSAHERLCAMGDADRCAALADLHASGNLGAGRVAFAPWYWARACAGKVGSACRKYGEYLREGASSSRDRVAAAKRFND